VNDDDDLSARLRHLVDRAQPVELDEVTHRRPGRSNRTLVAAIAGIAVLTLLAGAVALLRIDRDDTAPVTTDPPPTTVPAPGPTSTTTTPATMTTIPTGELPEVFAGVTTDGRLVVVDVATGQELRELDRLGDPTVSHDPEDGPGPNVIDSVDVTADGQVVYSDCCEPAAGNVYAIGLDGSPTTYSLPQGGSEHPFLSFGYQPAVGPDGRIATGSAGVGAIAVVDPDDPGHGIYLDEANASAAGAPTWLAGHRIAYQVGDAVYLVEVSDRAPGTRLGPDDDEVSWTNPVAWFDRLLVVEQCCGGYADEFEQPATGIYLDSETFEPYATTPFDAPVRDLDVSTAGALLVTFVDGRVAEVNPETGHPTVLATGFSAASW
jgi:hypothetical protein